MDSNEAQELLRRQLDLHRARSHQDLQSLIAEPEVIELVGESGTRYCIAAASVRTMPSGALRASRLATASGRLPSARIELPEPASSMWWSAAMASAPSRRRRQAEHPERIAALYQ